MAKFLENVLIERKENYIVLINGYNNENFCISGKFLEFSDDQIIKYIVPIVNAGYVRGQIDSSNTKIITQNLDTVESGSVVIGDIS